MDDDNIMQAANAAVREQRPLFIDRPVRLVRTWTPPHGLILRGDASERSVIFCLGESAGLDIRGTIDIDGITVDGGIDPSSDRAAGKFGCLVAIRGNLAAPAAYQNGVVVGSLYIRRTHRVGLVLANLIGAHIERLELHDVFCNGLIASGLKDCRIGLITAKNIGDLKGTGHRRGSAVAVMAETKPVAFWYDTRYVLPTETLYIGNVRISHTTDSAFYIHDELNRGVTNVFIGQINVDLAGKDGFKTRAGPKGVWIGAASIQRVALRGIDVESDDVQIEHINIRQCGYDAIGEIFGRPAHFSGHDGTAESIQTNPSGIVIMGCRNVEMPDFSVREVAANPANGSEGHGLHILGVENLRAKGSIAGSDGSGLRIAGSTNFDLDVTISDSCRKAPNNKPIRFASDGVGGSRHGQIRGTVHQAVGGPANQVVDADAACEVEIRVEYDPVEIPARKPFRGDPARPCGIKTPGVETAPQ